MELNWNNAKLWQEQVNEKKEIHDEPKWIVKDDWQQRCL